MIHGISDFNDDQGNVDGKEYNQQRYACRARQVNQRSGTSQCECHHENESNGISSETLTMSSTPMKAKNANAAACPIAVQGGQVVSTISLVVCAGTLLARKATPTAITSSSPADSISVQAMFVLDDCRIPQKLTPPKITKKRNIEMTSSEAVGVTAKTSSR